MNISVEELKQKIDNKEEILLVDVRTDVEREMAMIPEAIHIPMDELDEDHPALVDWRNRELYVMCHHGGRSARAQQYLMERGYKNVINVTGGIHAWSERVDSSVPTYE